MEIYTKQPIPESLRQLVFDRDGHACRYCGSTDRPLHADHVYPESRGGETSANNLVTSCASCNTYKWARIGMWPLPVGYFNDPEPSLNALDASYYDLLNRIERVALRDDFVSTEDYIQKVSEIWVNYIEKREKYYQATPVGLLKVVKEFIFRKVNNERTP